MLPALTATRYVTPLREGGSLPGIVEASDDGTYVMKFRGAGQGLKVLVAEVVFAELARACDIPTPDLAIVDLDPVIARYEADEEVQDLLTASIGTNLGIDFLPGSFGYDGRQPPAADLAARLLWLDAFAANPDRTWANPNLLIWHGQTWAIDAGASLWFHHSWPSRAPTPAGFARRPYDASSHILVDVVRQAQASGALDLVALDEECAERVTAGAEAAVGCVPDEWLETTEHLPDTGAVRAAYLEHIEARLAAREVWRP